MSSSSNSTLGRGSFALLDWSENMNSSGYGSVENYSLAVVIQCFPKIQLEFSLQFLKRVHAVDERRLHERGCHATQPVPITAKNA